MVFKFYQLNQNEELILVDNHNAAPQRIVHNCDGSIQIRRGGENDSSSEMTSNHSQRKVLNVKKRLSMESSNEEAEDEISGVEKSLLIGANDETIILNSTQQCSQCSSTSSSTSATTSAYFSCSDSTNYNAWANSSKFDDDYELDESENDNDDDDDLDKFNSCSIIDDDFHDSATNALLKIVHKNNDRSFSSSSFKTDLILSLCSQIDAKYTNVNKRRRVTTLGGSNDDQLKFNRTFWSYVLNKLGLLAILNQVVVPDDDDENHSRTATVERLQTNVDRLIATLNRLESELANYIVDHVTFNNSKPVVFDTEFVLNLAFLLFEQAVKLTETSSSLSSSLSSSSNSTATNPVTLVFELDIDLATADYSFELKLNELMSNWVLVYLPSMIDRVVRQGNEVETSYGNGKSIIDFFECLFKSKTFQPSSPKRIYSSMKTENDNCYNFFYDIEQDLNAPHFDSERGEFELSNPLSRSFSSLADNLVRLNYYSTDPSHHLNSHHNQHHNQHYHHYHHHYDDFGHYINSGNMSYSSQFGYLLASYYTMGAFELRSVLFENTCQPLHEAKMFEQECASLFYDYEQHEKQQKHFVGERSSLATASSMMWSYSSPKQALTETLTSPSVKKRSSSSSPLTPTKKCTNERLIIDEVVERVVIMAKSLEIDSPLTSPSKDSTTKTTSSKAASSSPNDSGGGGSNGNAARSWTVAPKLYPINSSLVKPLDNAHSNHLNHHSVAMNDKRVSTKSRAAESRPIGSKPISMLSRGSCNNHRGNNNNNNNNNNRCIQVATTKTSSTVKKSHAETSFMCDTTWQRDETVTSSGVSPFVMYSNSSSLTEGGFNINERIDLKKMLPSSNLTSMSSSNRSGYNSQQMANEQPPKPTRRYSVAPFFMLDHHYNQQQQQQQQQQQHTVYNFHKPIPTSSQYNTGRKSSLCYQPTQQQKQQLQNHIPPSLSIDNAIVSVSMSQPLQHHHQVAYSNNKNSERYSESSHRRGSFEDTIGNTYKYSSNLKSKPSHQNSNEQQQQQQRTRYK